MRIHKGYDEIDYTDWVIFKMLIKIYGEDKLINTLLKLKQSGGIQKVRTWS